jgi:hypothetical protein
LASYSAAALGLGQPELATAYAVMCGLMLSLSLKRSTWPYAIKVSRSRDR